MSDERRFLTVDMGDEEDEEDATPADDAGVLRATELMLVPPPELALAAEDGRAAKEEPTRSGRGGASPARVACLVLCICPAFADAAAAPPVEAASLRRLRAARASWADCFRAVEVEEVVSDATIVGQPNKIRIEYESDSSEGK